MTETPPKKRRRRRLRRVLGPVPQTDSLAAVNWAIRGLGQLLLEIDGDDDLTPPQRRAEFVRVANSMSRLRDPDRIYQAEQSLRDHKAAVADTRGPGPELEPAVAGVANARRGRPMKPNGRLR